MTETTWIAAPERVGRNVQLDVWRGLAVALMIFDHVAATIHADYLWRMPGRVALPLFMLVAGELYRPGWRPRHWQLVLAALLAYPLAVHLELPSPDVLSVIALGFAVHQLVPADRRVLLWVAVVGIAQAQWFPLWPVLVGGTGHELGAVVGWLALGRLGVASPRIALADPGPARRALAVAGRCPLSIYLGHLLLLFPVYAWSHVHDCACHI